MIQFNKWWSIAILVFSSFVMFGQCPQEEIEITRQSQLDSFPILYPNCQTLDYNIKLKGNDIKNLKGLKDIVVARRGFHIIACNNLESLEGLENLERVVSRGLSISTEAQISFEPLDNLVYASGIDLNISGVDTMRGFANITTIGGALNIGSKSMVVNDAFPRLKTIGGSLSFGFLNATQIGFDSLIWANELRSDANVATVDFSNMSPDFRCNKLHLRTARQLRSIDFLENFDSLEVLEMIVLPSLIDTTAVRNLKWIGDLRWSSIDVSSLAIFESLQTLGGLRLYDCDNLSDLNGLPSSCSIGGRVEVALCDQVTDLSGFDDLGTEAISSLTIRENPMLSTCSSEWVCDYLENGGDHLIHSNLAGCNTSEEILASCTTTSVSDAGLGAVYLYPNPASNRLYLSSPPAPNSQILVMDLSGHAQHLQVDGDRIDISGLSSGYYILHIVSGDDIITHSFVKY